jgi:putative transposase
VAADPERLTCHSWQRPPLEVYLHAYESVAETHRRLARYFTFYNQGRPHSALDRQTPDMVYFSLRPQREAA